MDALVIFTLVVYTWYITKLTDDALLRNMIYISTKLVLSYIMISDITLYDYINDYNIVLLQYPYTVLLVVFTVSSIVVDVMNILRERK